MAAIRVFSASKGYRRGTKLRNFSMKKAGSALLSRPQNYFKKFSGLHFIL